jgi:protein-S-isoprenylcysteine O-methyltransferase Ste14
MNSGYLFLIPLLAGFAFNWASAFTHFYSRKWGERPGRTVTFITRNILGIPVWAFGVVLATRTEARPLFVPGTAAQTLAWAFLGLGTVLMVWALGLLRLRSFRPTEKDTLVDRGLFACIRHPIYSGLLLDFIGIVLMRPTVSVLISCTLGWVFVFIQARLEEMDLVERIPAYGEYMRRVPRFFPRFKKAGRGGSPHPFSGSPPDC